MPASRRRLIPKLKHKPARRTLAERLAQKIATPPPPNPTAGDDDPLFDVLGVASYLGVNHWWVYDHRNDLPTLKIGRFLKFRRSHVDRWLEAKKAKK